MTKQKYYAVHNGRQGTQIYTTWEEVSRYSGAIHKSFRTLPEARAWLLGVADAAVSDATPPYSFQQAPPEVENDASMQIDHPPESAIPPAEEIKLSPEQQQVMDMVKRGESVFFTGSAGMYYPPSMSWNAQQIGADTRDHQVAWRSSEPLAWSDGLDWDRFSQYRRMHATLLGGHRSRKGGQGRPGR
ncbi:hypothetical protein BD414DRAFT_513230 [Trametes punicea]|nr:hypothetical protein BD414DRAFT_513230 [Trametes punicea]